MNEQNFNPNASPAETNFVPAICTNCGGELTVDPTQEATVCQYCGTPFVVSKAIQNYEIKHTTYTTNVVNDQRKGTVESVLNFVSERQDKKQQRIDEMNRRKEEKKRSRNRLILWVLGWLFIFPVPLTILMLRNKSLQNKVRFAIIGAGWAVYLVFMLVNGNSGDSNAELKQDSGKTVDETSVTDVIDETSESEENNGSEAVEESKTGSDESTITESKVESEAEIKSESKTESKSKSDTKSDLSADDIKKKVKDGDYSLVTPEFKETMDSYEAFYDEYIEFMNKYNSDGADIMSMLNDYMDMIDKLNEWSEKIDAIDESALSPADDAYYLLVTLRIEKKLVGTVY